MKLVTTDDPECQEASCRFREVPPSLALQGILLRAGGWGEEARQAQALMVFDAPASSCLSTARAS